VCECPSSLRDWDCEQGRVLLLLPLLLLLLLLRPQKAKLLPKTPPASYCCLWPAFSRPASRQQPGEQRGAEGGAPGALPLAIRPEADGKTGKTGTRGALRQTEGKRREEVLEKSDKRVRQSKGVREHCCLGKRRRHRISALGRGLSGTRSQPGTERPALVGWAASRRMTFAMLRAAPPTGRYLYSDIALLSEDDEDNGSEGSGSEERGALNATNNNNNNTTTSSYRISSSSSSPSAFHIKVNRKRKLSGGEGGGLGLGLGGGGDDGGLLRLGPPGSSPGAPGEFRQRNAANARERDRTNSIETLRLASSYISHLGNVLLLGEGLHDGQPCHAPSPPFFHLSSSPTRVSDQSAQPKHICTFCLSNQRKMAERSNK
ncbi:hypothetical protein CRUP_021248, partial [Coryphaenoides rupestris]